MSRWDAYDDMTSAEPVVNADTFLVKNVSDTTQNVSGSVNEVTLSVLNPSLGGGVSFKAYGALGDGSTNDTTAIQTALTAGGDLYLPTGTYMVDGGLSTAAKVHIYGSGSLKVIAGKNYDSVLQLTGDSSIVEGITIDQSATTSNTGTNNGLVVTADKYTVRKVFAIGTGSNGTTGNTIEVTGDGLVHDCDSVNARLNGLRVNGGTDARTIVRDYRCTDHYGGKGIVFNGTGYSLIIDGAYINSTSGSALDGILVDVDVNSLRELFISNIVVEGTHTSNDMKIADDGSTGSIDHVSLKNISLRSTGGVNAILCNFDGQLKIDSLYCKNDLHILSRIKKAEVSNAYVDVTTDAPLYGIRAEANGIMSFRDVKVKGYTAFAFRYDESANTYMLMDNIETIGAAAADRFISVVTRVTPGRVQLGSVIVTTGDTSEATGFTGNSSYEMNLQMNLGQRPRTFHANAAPTMVAGVGDIVYDRLPATGAPLGWIQVDRYDTTVDGDEAAAQTTISVADATGIADTDIVGILLDSGAWHWSQVNGAPVGNDVAIDDALPSQASDGATFIAGGWNALANLA